MSFIAVTTTVTAVPVTAAYIVGVVTMSIALPWMDCTIFFTLGIVNVFLILSRHTFLILGNYLYALNTFLILGALKFTNPH